LRSIPTVIVALLAGFLPLQPVNAQAPHGKSVTVRGKIAAVEGRALKVATSIGEVSVGFSEDVRISGFAAAQLSQITTG